MRPALPLLWLLLAWAGVGGAVLAGWLNGTDCCKWKRSHDESDNDKGFQLHNLLH